MSSYIANVEDANCASTDPDLFFADTYKDIERVYDVCVMCPIIEECLTYAVANEPEFGIWAATSPRKRRLMRKNYTLIAKHLIALDERKKELWKKPGGE